VEKKSVMRKRKTIEARCIICDKVFMSRIDQLRAGRGQTCSHSCAATLASITRRQDGPHNNNWKGGEPTNYRLSKRRYRARHPEKARAHMMVRDAIAVGILHREPCSICGALASQAHHEDYSRPLDVNWLCKEHHEQRHIELRKKGIGRYR